MLSFNRNNMYIGRNWKKKQLDFHNKVLFIWMIRVTRSFSYLNPWTNSWFFKILSIDCDALCALLMIKSRLLIFYHSQAYWLLVYRIGSSSSLLMMSSWCHPIYHKKIVPDSNRAHAVQVVCNPFSWHNSQPPWISIFQFHAFDNPVSHKDPPRTMLCLAM